MALSNVARRILVCDDEAGIIEAYHRIFAGLLVAEEGAGPSDYDALSAELFGDAPAPAVGAGQIDDVVYCRQGEEAVAVFAEAKRAGTPFGAVFMDVRMPPGIDGVEAAKRIRTVDPAVNIVMVTGYSDHRPAEIADRVDATDRLFYLVKPFNADEVRQMATTLVNRWESDRKITRELAERLDQLERMNVALQASEASAHEAARRDPLTGLLNRKGLEEGHASALAEAGDRKLALLYVDLDRFKLVNDTHGHGVGDLLIRDVASRILGAIGDDGLAARLGGDEFAILCLDARKLDALLHRVLRAADTPFVTTSHHLQVGLSIGYTTSAAEVGLQEAMRQADVALYVAKAAGRGVARAFDPQLDEAFLRNQTLARDLEAAIASDALALHYQPLMCIDGQRVTGVEALLRWHHPEIGPVSPEVFVTVAEANNLMVPLGDWVLRRAFEDIRAWPDLITSINLSAAQFVQPDFAEHVIALCRRMGALPDRIEFEITETTLASDLGTFASQVQVLREAGFRFALDDFGSGYASIGYLSRLTFDKLKIDRSFVSALSTKPHADRMIRSIVGLGTAMGLSVTAEGVEDALQHDILRSTGCDQLQGFLFHRPCPRNVLEDILSRQRRMDDAA
jgi:diguanylate cyclase (GGDEF)-like protein